MQMAKRVENTCLAEFVERPQGGKWRMGILHEATTNRITYFFRSCLEQS